MPCLYRCRSSGTTRISLILRSEVVGREADRQRSRHQIHLGIQTQPESQRERVATWFLPFGLAVNVGVGFLRLGLGVGVGIPGAPRALEPALIPLVSETQVTAQFQFLNPGAS